MEDGMFYKAELDYLMRVMRKIHLQALLLARTLRGDLDAYPPFFWK